MIGFVARSVKIRILFGISGQRWFPRPFDIDSFGSNNPNRIQASATYREKEGKKKYDRNFDRTVVQKKRRESNTAHKKHRPQQRARTIFKIHVSIKLINWIDSIHASNSQKRCPLYLFLAIPMFASCVILQRFCCYFTFLPFGLSVGFCIFVACTQPTEPYVHFFSKFFVCVFSRTVFFLHILSLFGSFFFSSLVSCSLASRSAFILTCLTNSFCFGQYWRTFVIPSFVRYM